MASYNRVILIGNLTRDPELRYTPKGTAVAKIGLAVNRVFRTETGDSREETTFVDIDAFGRQAELIGQYLKKGSPLFMEGRLRLDQWEDKQTGQKRSRLGVVLESFQFLGSSKGSGAGGGPPSAAPVSAAPAVEPGDSGPNDDDVPF